MEDRLNMNQFSLYLNVSISYPLKYNAFCKKLKPPSPILTAIQTVGTFREAFGERFTSLFKKTYCHICETEEQLFTYAIPRCLMLVEYGHYYFSFLLVCACIAELMNYLEIKTNCYRFTWTGYKCFLAVYKRAFEPNFEELGGWKGLVSFCLGYKDIYFRKGVYKSLTNRLTFNDRDHKKRIHHIIKKCAILKDVGLILTDYDLSLIGSDQDFFLDAKQDVATIQSPDEDCPDTMSVLYIEPCAATDSLSIIEITAKIESLDTRCKTGLKPSVDIESKPDLESAYDVEPVGGLLLSFDNDSILDQLIDIGSSYSGPKALPTSFSDIDSKPDVKSSDIKSYSNSSSEVDSTPDSDSSSSDVSTRDFKISSDGESVPVILLEENELSSTDLDSLPEYASGTDLNSLSKDKSFTEFDWLSKDKPFIEFDSLSKDKTITELHSLSKDAFAKFNSFKDKTIIELNSLSIDESDTDSISLSKEKSTAEPISLLDNESGCELNSMFKTKSSKELDSSSQDTSYANVSSFSEDNSGSDLESWSEITYCVFDSSTDSESSTASDSSTNTYIHSNRVTADLDTDDNYSPTKPTSDQEMSKRVCSKCNLRCFENANSLFEKLLDSTLTATS